MDNFRVKNARLVSAKLCYSKAGNRMLKLSFRGYNSHTKEEQFFTYHGMLHTPKALESTISVLARLGGEFGDSPVDERAGEVTSNNVHEVTRLGTSTANLSCEQNGQFVSVLGVWPSDGVEIRED